MDQSIQESINLLEQHQCSRLLVDVRKQTAPLELVDTFDLCKNLLQRLPQDLRIAYIVNDPPRQSHRFFTLLAESLERPVNAFYAVEEALEWFAGNVIDKKMPFIGRVKFPS